MECRISVPMNMVHFGRLVLFVDSRRYLVGPTLVIFFIVFGV